MRDPLHPLVSSRVDPAAGVPAPFMVNHLILPLLMPVAVIRSYWRAMPLGKAYLVHLYGLVLAGAGLAVADLSYSDSYLMQIAAGDVVLLLDLIVSGTLFLLTLECSYFAFGFVTMSWAAGPEPWGVSHRRSLARWYQLTPWHAAATLAYFGLASLVEPGYNDYLTNMFLISVLTAGYLLGVMAMTLRALATPTDPAGWPARCRWPMTCEGCGYLLAGQSLGQSCPECGLPVAHSADCGRGRLALMRPFAVLLLGATQPRRLGRLLVAHAPTHGHGRVLAAGIALLMATGPVGVLMLLAVMMMFDEIRGGFDGEVFAGLLITSIFGAAIATVMAVSAALLGGSLVGTGFRVFAGRNVMHLAGQAAAYTCGLLPLWVLGNWLLTALSVGAIASSFNYGSPAWAALLPLLWLLGNLGFVAVYLVILTRVINGARWANV